MIPPQEMQPQMVQQPPVMVQQPPVMVQQPPVMVQQPPVMVQQPPVMVQQPPVMVPEQPVILTKGRKELKFKTPISVGIELKDSKVTNVLPSSELMGVIFVGDFILNVNGCPASTTPEFTAAVNSKLPGSVVLEYMRDEMCKYELKILPPRKAGYEMYEITLIWRSGGTPIGLLIHRDFSGRVVIAMVESGCTASKVVKPGDILLKVNNTEVQDRDVSRRVNEWLLFKAEPLVNERCDFFS
ncbi:PDZ domain-containing protein [Trichostrongylus colubriformis]|uniref:PDZ domain-containing protein n=1 Tax=Trichostrongylus colubriformis TaxID=6319 RepID=A0AAN8IQ68_TRICO